MKNWAPAKTRIEDILIRPIEKGAKKITLAGTSSSLPVSLFLSQSLSKEFNDLPRLVVVSSLEQARLLEQQFAFFSPEIRCHILQQNDVSPYSGLYASAKVSIARCNFLYWANRATHHDIFICPIGGLLQLTAPFYSFNRRCFNFKQGDELPENISDFLTSLGYQAAPLVEDQGQFSIRGGLIDIFSAAESEPIRIELFGDQIESLRFFSVLNQRSTADTKEINLSPVYEVEFSNENIEKIILNFRKTLVDRNISASDIEDVIRNVSLKNYFPGCEQLLSSCYDQLSVVLDHFSSGLNIFLIDTPEISRQADQLHQELQVEEKNENQNVFNAPLNKIFLPLEKLIWPEDSKLVQLSNLVFLDEESASEERLNYRTNQLPEFSQISHNLVPGTADWIKNISSKINLWLKDEYKIIVSSKTQISQDRVHSLLEKMSFSSLLTKSDEFDWENLLDVEVKNKNIILIPRPVGETILLVDEKLIFLRDDDFLGKKQRSQVKSAYEDFSSKAKSLSFADLKPQDLVVHIKHGIGVYEGLKIMNIGGVESEFIQIAYKDKDKLYLPVYRIGQLQKFSAAGSAAPLDKLGGTGWEKTKIKVKSHLKDIAAELLKLYSERQKISRPPFRLDPIEYSRFENSFPFQETEDQLKAISDIQKDFSSEKPMDRLVCGDVGFGKTEVSMRAAFEAIESGKQVAVLAPTTVLTFQHFETFKKRFHGWPIEIRLLNRFVTPADQKKSLAATKDGAVQILIGTHRLLSKDVQFKNLGLLIVDEEQKFGVTHKEKIKKFKTDVDTLTLSATPIPRTLNMSFTGMRDLSIINTPPVDRLPTRTFISIFNPDLIGKAIRSEISRGGQVYFIHNRIQSIYGLADEIRGIVPEARIKVAHGQMNEDELEAAMLAFFNHEIDVLICTAIVESGMDVPRANTMFIDQAHMFGLSQLYQLRGRVGRSKARAYCYLLLPKDKKIEKDAQERLKIIQENSSLGSGIKIAQYDLELRGAGNILGDDQSGHINSVGYELYMDLLNESLAEARGEEPTDRELDPEINLRIPALIPDAYIADIRIRLSYYKALAEITSQEDLDRIEEELKDQFGEIPEPVVNLMGLMLIRKLCKDLGVRDVSAGLKNISLIFTDRTRMKPETVIHLATRENKKYSLTPDQRLNVRMNNITWMNVYDELQYLITLI